MMRAARFAAQLGFDVAPRCVAAMTAMAARIEIVAAERVRRSSRRSCSRRDPRRGLELLVDTGLADHVLPELPALQARDRRAPPAQGRLRAHPDGARAGRRARGRSRRPGARARPAAAPRRAAARHRQAGDPPVRAGRRRELPPPRARRAPSWRRAGSRRCGSTATPSSRSPGWSSCTCASTGTATPTGPTRRSAATSPTPARCSSGCTS